MDGFEPGARVVVMAATNRAEILDAALLRGLLLERETIDGADLAAIVGTPQAADHEPAGAPLALTMKWYRSR